MAVRRTDVGRGDPVEIDAELVVHPRPPAARDEPMIDGILECLLDVFTQHRSDPPSSPGGLSRLFAAISANGQQMS